jgi:hypothetical protein
VGYLDDGTMVVVEGARQRIGERVPVIVTGALQNPTGRIVFARCEGEPASPAAAASPAPAAPASPPGVKRRRNGKAAGGGGAAPEAQGDPDSSSPR